MSTFPEFFLLIVHWLLLIWLLQMTHSPSELLLLLFNFLPVLLLTTWFLTPFPERISLLCFLSTLTQVDCLAISPQCQLFYSNLTLACFGVLNHLIAIHSFLSYIDFLSEPCCFEPFFFSDLSGKTEICKQGCCFFLDFLLEFKLLCHLR